MANEQPAQKSSFSSIMEHVGDAYEWHFATWNHTHLSLPLPIIIYKKGHGIDIFISSKLHNEDHQLVAYKGYRLNKNGKIVSLDGRKIYDISMTKTVVAMLLSVVILLLIFLLAAARYRRASIVNPSGFWALLEIFILFVRDGIAKPNIGPKYERFMPYLLTVFFFIWLNNLLGLLPGAANVTGNISVTLTLACFTLGFTLINANKHYWKHILNMPGLPKWLLPLMIPIEVIGIFTRPFSLMIRLFANITAGHIILLCIISLIFIFHTVFAGAVSVPFGAFMFSLKLLVAFLQAYVFTLLSAIYFGGAVEESHEGYGETHEASH